MNLLFKNNMIEESVKLKLNTAKIAIIGLGYVGLPLAVEFGKKYKTKGYDIDERRINELNLGIDKTKELKGLEFENAKQLQFTSDLSMIAECNIFIVTVPTPIDNHKRPDLKPLITASTEIGQVLKIGDIVIYESTVYPGCTEEDCVPILEENSGLKYNKDFFCGYSPERIVPGDKERTLTTIKKITSGSNQQVAVFVDALYSSIISAGTFQAASIKVAEAAKVIENCQRDLNISFVNELALIFDRMNIDTNDVIDAAGSKFNFVKYKPGLVGGHCISVDPYYLTSKSESLGYYPEVIHSGRRINDNMSVFIASKVVKLLISKNQPVNCSRILILGITFKENCPDIRNSKVVDVVSELNDFGCVVECYDPEADPLMVAQHFKINVVNEPQGLFHAIIHAVAHDKFKKIDLRSFLVEDGVIFDIKSTLDRNIVDGRL